MLDFAVAAWGKPVEVAAHPEAGTSIKVPLDCGGFDYTRTWRSHVDGVEEWAAVFLDGLECERLNERSDSEGRPCVSWGWSVDLPVGKPTGHFVVNLELVEIAPQSWAFTGVCGWFDGLESNP